MWNQYRVVTTVIYNDKWIIHLPYDIKVSSSDFMQITVKHLLCVKNVIICFSVNQIFVRKLTSMKKRFKKIAEIHNEFLTTTKLVITVIT